MKNVRGAIFAIAAAVVSSGCSPEPEELGSTGQALTDGYGNDQDNGYGYNTAYNFGQNADECSPQVMIAQAPPERQAILQRAGRWVDNPVPYSQSNYVDGYRCDCSGYVSMAWGAGDSFTTQDLPPNTSDAMLGVAINWNELQPGDALNNSHHMRLVAGMTRSGELCIWEQLQSGTSTMSHAESVDSAAGNYTPVRSAWIGYGSSPSYQQQ
jgi:hypothetical protein